MVNLKSQSDSKISLAATQAASMTDAAVSARKVIAEATAAAEATSAAAKSYSDAVREVYRVVSQSMSNTFYYSNHIIEYWRASKDTDTARIIRFAESLNYAEKKAIKEEMDSAIKAYTLLPEIPDLDNTSLVTIKYAIDKYFEDCSVFYDYVYSPPSISVNDYIHKWSGYSSACNDSSEELFNIYGPFN